MGSSVETAIAVTASDQRGLIERLCMALDDALAGDESEHGGELIPWQAMSASFADLPGDIVRLLVETLDDEGARLVAIEFGGFLTTDQGVRAWGTVAFHPANHPNAVKIDPASIAVIEVDGGWRFEATLSRREVADA